MKRAWAYVTARVTRAVTVRLVQVFHAGMGLTLLAAIPVQVTGHDRAAGWLLFGCTMSYVLGQLAERLDDIVRARREH